MEPQSVTHVLYHADCFDGFGAAFAAWKALGDRAEYLPVRYGHPAPDLPARARVAMVDFSYPREDLLELKGRVQDLLVLDHHKSAMESLQGLEFARFDLDRAGAGLAWEYFHPGKPEPELLRYVEDRDLWRFALPDSREVSAALAAHPRTFETWDSLEVEDLRREGRPLLQERNRLVAAAADGADLGEIGGYRVPVVRVAPDLRSEVASTLLQRYPEAPFAAVWFLDHDGLQAWSLRSRGDFDVSALAARYGGGGHRAASGFTCEPGEFLRDP